MKDEESQARSAEIVLECGGDVGELKFVKWGTDWLTADDFKDRLRSIAELAVSFNGDFSYDEDRDEVHPKEFREDFVISDEIALVLKHNGSILRVGSTSWPSSITGKTKGNEPYVEFRTASRPAGADFPQLGGRGDE